MDGVDRSPRSDLLSAIAPPSRAASASASTKTVQDDSHDPFGTALNAATAAPGVSAPEKTAVADGGRESAPFAASSSSAPDATRPATALSGTNDDEANGLSTANDALGTASSHESTSSDTIAEIPVEPSAAEESTSIPAGLAESLLASLDSKETPAEKDPPSPGHSTEAASPSLAAFIALTLTPLPPISLQAAGTLQSSASVVGAINPDNAAVSIAPLNDTATQAPLAAPAASLTPSAASTASKPEVSSTVGAIVVASTSAFADATTTKSSQPSDVEQASAALPAVPVAPPTEPYRDEPNRHSEKDSTPSVPDAQDNTNVLSLNVNLAVASQVVAVTSTPKSTNAAGSPAPVTIRSHARASLEEADVTQPGAQPLDRTALLTKITPSTADPLAKQSGHLGQRVDSVKSLRVDHGGTGASYPETEDRSALAALAGTTPGGFSSTVPPLDTGAPVPFTDPQQLVQRVTDAVGSAAQSGQQLSIRLSPPDFGPVLVEVSMTDQGLSARVEAQSPATQQLLIDHLPQLHDSLAARGSVLDRIEVFGADHRLPDRIEGDRPASETSNGSNLWLGTSGRNPYDPQESSRRRPPRSSVAPSADPAPAVEAVVAQRTLQLQELNIRV